MSDFKPAKGFYAVSAIREAEAQLLAQHSEPGELMEKAGRAGFDWLMERTGECERFVLCCGSGGNGGDGLVIARLLHEAEKSVCVYLPQDPKHQDSQIAHDKALQAGVGIKEQLQGCDFEDAQVIVDCLLGIGGSVREDAPYAEAIRAINQAEAPVYAIDIPSGVDPNTGAQSAEAVRAAATLCMIAPAGGLAGGLACAGDIAAASLGGDMQGYDPVCRVLAPYSAVNIARDAHKGTFDHAVIISGDRGYGGAGLLAAEGAAVGGAGLTTLCTRPEHTTAALAFAPDLMVQGAEVGSDIQEALDKASAILCGPGLGQNAWGEQMLLESLRAARQKDIALVLDADALNLLTPSQVASLADMKAVITPHPGEAARLLDTTSSEVQNDRLAAVCELHELTGATVVLKGCGTLIAHSAGDIRVANCGNAALARGGSGDVLAGLIVGQLAFRGPGYGGEKAQLDSAISLRETQNDGRLGNAVLAHGRAADALVIEHGIRGVRPQMLAKMAGRLVSEMAYRVV